jgi:epoxyqueuosine reductase
MFRRIAGMVLIAVVQDYEAMKAARSIGTLIEVTRQYAGGTRVAKCLANWPRRGGQDAFPHGGPMAGSFVLIPAAIEAGLGELGKHGSMIHHRLGSNFRLACALTNAPFWRMPVTISAQLTSA